jgi:hypothetical protein
MQENVPVRFGRGRLDSRVTKGLATYLITSLGAKSDCAETCEYFVSGLPGLIPRRSLKSPYVSRLADNQACEHDKIWSRAIRPLEAQIHRC